MRQLKQLILLFILGLPLAVAAEPLRVFVSVLPEQTFVERIGGAHVQVESLVKPGDNPHTFEPTPSQISRLADADLYLRIGMPFEAAWVERIRGVNPDIRILDLSANIKRRPLEAHDHDDDTHHDHAEEHEHEHEASEPDPHIWTSPILVERMGQEIAAVLSEMDPSHAANYAANLAAFEADLDALDRDIREILKPISQRRFMVFHPAWGYFADAYGLTQIPIEHEGKEPGPRSLAALIDQARHAETRVIFVQPQFSRRAAEQVANAIGGRVESIDNLAPDYFANLRHVAQVIADAQR
ncbi:metal ABC transporter solute-binding protein, Zn/Mn family [Thiorhodococcus fuscus]|uniref:High-affinity zinc uptake system protein ZnuA n=1 Tax=Thiorhodococcus fuscus TaxID=527200 RepID=A0ABW4Y2L6_9GAMM